VKNPFLAIPDVIFRFAFECCVHSVCKRCRISERQSTSIAADDTDKVTPPKSMPNQKPARGRPRKVFCFLFFLMQ